MTKRWTLFNTRTNSFTKKAFTTRAAARRAKTSVTKVYDTANSVFVR